MKILDSHYSATPKNLQRHFLLFGFLFLPWIVAYSQNPGDALFNSSQIHTVKFYFQQAKWYDSLVYYKPLDKKMLGNVEINGTYVDSVGVQFKGNSSFNTNSTKKSWKIDFNEFVSGQKYDGLKTLNLNNCFKDPTFMREKLFNDFCRTVGIYGPRTTYANVYVNDTLWGFYTMVEQVDKTLLKTQIGNDGGNLFKGDPNGTLQTCNSPPPPSCYYTRYELKTNETANDWTDLVRLIEKIDLTPSASFYDSVEMVLNSTAWIKGWAANNIFVNLDSYTGSGHNYYIYHNTVTDKFDFIVWDCNETFGNFNMGMSIPQLENLSLSFIPNPASSRPLTNRMLQNNTYHNNYINTVCNFVANYFSNAYFDPKIDSLYNVIKPHVYADTKKVYSNQQFENNINQTVMGNIPGLKSFIANRRTSLVNQLAAYGCIMDVNEQTHELMFQIYPNPITDKAMLEIADSHSQVTEGTFKLYDVFGKKVMELPITESSLTIDKGNLKDGIYFFQIILAERMVGKGKVAIE